MPSNRAGPQSDEALLVCRVDDVVVDRETLGVPPGNVHEHRTRITADDIGAGSGEFTRHDPVAAPHVEDRLAGGHIEQAVQRWREQQPMELTAGGSRPLIPEGCEFVPGGNDLCGRWCISHASMLTTPKTELHASQW